MSCFYTCLSVILGGGLHLGEWSASGGVCIWGGLHPGGVGQTPQPDTTGYSKHTSYWNAFLFSDIKLNYAIYLYWYFYDE